MLTSEHAIARYERGRLWPDKLVQSTHGHYVAHAKRMLEIYRQGVGQTRGVLHRAVEKLFFDEPECPPRRIAAFCKLLDDVSDFETAPDAWALRLKVFRAAAPHHPLVEHPDRMFGTDNQTTK